MTKKYDSTVARIAGNIASGFISNSRNALTSEEMATITVEMARLIVEEVIRTEKDNNAT